MSEIISEEKELLKSASKMFEKYGLTEIRLKSGDNEVYFKKETFSPMPTVQPSMMPDAVSAVQATSSQAAMSQPLAGISSAHEYVGNDRNDLKSPLLGIFYSSPSPDSQPFVKVGDSVKCGDILCIVEAMKMMNEICAEYDGTVSEICVENGSMVEYGQTLFKIKPTK